MSSHFELNINMKISNNSFAMKIIENFIKNQFLTICTNSEEYVSGYKSKKRIILVTFRRLMIFVTIIRFGLLALINKVKMNLYHQAYNNKLYTFI